MNVKVYYLLVLFGVVVSKLFGQQVIQIDAAKIEKSFPVNPVGINLNYLMDDDSRHQPEIPLEKSLDLLSVGTIRFPGGEKSDNYFWSVPPYEITNPYFAIQGPCTWPNTDARFSDDALQPNAATLDFDEMMNIAETNGLDPLIVVPADAQYFDEPGCSVYPSREELIQHAAAWVRYANIEKGYGITYWMVGNESFHSAVYDEPTSARQYAQDFLLFSAAMKEVDPSIKVLANTQEGVWVKTLLKIVDSDLDGIGFSNYPVYQWRAGYTSYLRDDPNLVGGLEEIESAIQSHDPESQIELLVTEFGSMDWSEQWEHANDLGHAIVAFQMMGDQLALPHVSRSYLWNTRWVDNEADPQNVFDALDENGQLNATGKALSIWGNFLLPDWIFASNTSSVFSYATQSKDKEELTVFLLNKTLTNTSIQVEINNFPALRDSATELTRWQFTGTGPSDMHPVIEQVPAETQISGSKLTLQLPGVSVTVLQLGPSSAGYQDSILVQELLLEVEDPLIIREGEEESASLSLRAVNTLWKDTLDIDQWIFHNLPLGIEPFIQGREAERVQVSFTTQNIDYDSTSRIEIRVPASQFTNLRADFLAVRDQLVFQGKEELITARNPQIDAPALLALYPNPASQSLILKTHLAQGTPTQFRLFDLHGKEVFAATESFRAPGTYIDTYNLPYMAPGIYLYSLAWGDKLIQGKIIRQ